MSKTFKSYPKGKNLFFKKVNLLLFANLSGNNANKIPRKASQMHYVKLYLTYSKMVLNFVSKLPKYLLEKEVKRNKERKRVVFISRAKRNGPVCCS